jgi:hypothetical protein
MQSSGAMSNISNALSDKLRLELRLHSDHLSVNVLNTSAQELRIWELENSWGWDSFSFHLRVESDKEIRILKRKFREWTRNAPTYFVLSPGESRQMRLDMNDGWWEMDQDLSKLKDELIWVRATYSVDLSPEAEKYGVFVSTTLSDWVISRPPHGWLFTAN